MLSFEIDDMTAEEIGVAADRLRAAGGVRDLVLIPAIGKKGRPVHTFRLLVEPTARDAVAEACFTETSTIGLRWQAARRAVLPRATCGCRRGAREDGDTARGSQPQGGERRPCPHRGTRSTPRRQTHGGGAMTELEAILADLPGLAIAVSGGVDSMTLAHAAHRAGLPGLLVVHALSPAVPAEATVRVRDHATRFGWRLTEVDAGEFADPAYRANPVNRCYFCKTNLYDRIAHVTEGPIASGANLDDLGDYRPGLIAAAEHRVRHPFVEAGMDKAAVRALARGFDLADISELPAQPCLVEPRRNGHCDQRQGPRLRRAHGAGACPHVPQGTDLRCRVTHGGIVVEAPEPDDAMRQIADELCAGERRRFLGFRPYRRGAAFLHGRA